MNGTIVRRIEQLERGQPRPQSGPAFIMAPNRDAAARELERLQEEHGDRMPRAMFVMIFDSGDEK